VVTSLITGMSAVGKSTVVAELSARSHRAVDLDTPEWSQLAADDSEFADPAVETPMDWGWREDKVRALLSTAGEGPLFVAGTSTHQGRLYPLLDHVVLLSIPVAVARARLAERSTNDYGKDPAELARELELRATVEPLLRGSACLEIDTSTHSPPELAALLTAHASGTSCRAR
jgi:broad-specificity NMP kinase